MSIQKTITPENTLFVLGAGVDVALGLPTMHNLLNELARFISDEGKEVEAAIRKHVKRMQFNLRKMAGEQGEQFGEFLITNPSQLQNVKNALSKHKEQDGPKIQAISHLINNLEKICHSNYLDDETCKALSEINKEQYDPGGGDYLFNPRGLTLTNTPRQAMRKIFQGELSQIDGLTEEEKQDINGIVCAVSNIEEILGDFFTDFFTKYANKQKKYYYLSWLLWAYLRHKQTEGTDRRKSSFYRTLADLNNHNIITFNYTDFYYTDDYSGIARFHGSCNSYIRLDNREFIQRDDRIDKAETMDDLARFFEEIGQDIDWSTDPPKIFIPAIVPPLSVKPIICNEYLEGWASAASRIAQAQRIVIVGYSFNQADEHFNDLIRKRNQSAPSLSSTRIFKPSSPRYVASSA